VLDVRENVVRFDDEDVNVVAIISFMLLLLDDYVANAYMEHGGC